MAICVFAHGVIGAPATSRRSGGSLHPVGQCYRVAGTVSLSGDSGFVLGRDDTGRALTVSSVPGSDWPQNLSGALTRAQKQTGFASAQVHGTFEVCPVRFEGAEDRDYIRITAASRLRAERPGERR